MTFNQFCKAILIPSNLRKKFCFFSIIISDKTVLKTIEMFSHKDFNFDVYKSKHHDKYGIKILYIFVRKSFLNKKTFEKLGIDNKIYFDTYGCYSRFLKETFVATGIQSFDRYWWTIRQANLKLFRIGELEFEYLDNLNIAIHIPSDAKLNGSFFCRDIADAKEFFSQKFQIDNNAKFSCDSRLLSPNLKYVLNEDSNIIKFSKNFKIVNFDENNTDYYFRVFKTYDKDESKFVSVTTLQKNIKAKLKDGLKIGSAQGYLI